MVFLITRFKIRCRCNAGTSPLNATGIRRPLHRILLHLDLINLLQLAVSSLCD